MNQRVLVMINSSVGLRLDGVARCAREHGWHLMIQDRLGPEHPFDWPCDGVVATVMRGTSSADNGAPYLWDKVSKSFAVSQTEYAFWDSGEPGAPFYPCTLILVR